MDNGAFWTNIFCREKEISVEKNGDEDEDDAYVYCEVCGFDWEADSPCPYH